MILPDVLDYNLKLIFCGTAAGLRSASTGYYYAGKGNKFWRTLYEVGLTDRLFEPKDYQALLSYDIGLTDLAKYASGMDNNLSGSDFDVESLNSKMQMFQPALLCFNGKKAAKVFFQMDWVDYGVQNHTIGRTKIHVLPSTSAANNANWDISYWYEISALIKER